MGQELPYVVLPKFIPVLVTKHRKLGDLQQQKFILSPLRRLEIGNQGVDRVGSLELKGRIRPRPLSLASGVGWPSFALLGLWAHPISASVLPRPSSCGVCAHISLL